MVQIRLPRILAALQLKPAVEFQSATLVPGMAFCVTQDNPQELLLVPVLGIEVALLRADRLELKGHKTSDSLGRRVQVGLEFDEHAADLIHVAAEVLNAVGQGVIILQCDELRQLIGL